MEKKGRVFNLQRYSIHDGEGIRTVIFLKGCPLRCQWCCNPESQNKSSELFYIKKFCQRCGGCIEVCKQGALRLIDHEVTIDREKCIQCFNCVEACRNEAMQRVGEDYTPSEIIERVIRDYPMYEVSGGGVTLSGGEALSQPEFALEILRLAKENGIDTMIETCGACKTPTLLEVLEYCSKIYFDLKIINNEMHKRYIGTDNLLILNNARKVADNSKIVFRLPVIPGITGSIDNINDVIDFLKEINRDEIILVPYHELGVEKYSYLGRTYEQLDETSSIDAYIEGVEKIFMSQGIRISRA